MSLAVLNEGRDLSARTTKAPQSRLGTRAGADRRPAALGEDVVLPLYTALGNRFHLAKAAARAVRRSKPLSAGPTCRASLADAMTSADYDEALRASHKDGIERVGMEVGTPIIAVNGHAFFGPVVTPMPRGEAAAKLWDGVLLVTSTDGFFELKRTRDRKPEFSA